MVAKTYQKLETKGDFFEENGKKYIYVITKKGAPKKVRYYEPWEYQKLYPNEVVEDSRRKPLKNVLGFNAGYVWKLKGNQEKIQNYFETIVARDMVRFHTLFGWYIITGTDFAEKFDDDDIELYKFTWEEALENYKKNNIDISKWE